MTEHNPLASIDWPNLSPPQALVLWELVETIATAIWQHYEDRIVPLIIEQHRPARDP